VVPAEEARARQAAEREEEGDSAWEARELQQAQKEQKMEAAETRLAAEVVPPLPPPEQDSAVHLLDRARLVARGSRHCKRIARAPWRHSRRANPWGMRCSDYRPCSP